MEFSYNSSNFDLYVNSLDELKLILKYAYDNVDELASETTYITFEISTAYNDTELSLKLSQACASTGVSAVCWFEDVDVMGNSVYSIKLSA